jgi:hypothetical protein
MLGCRSCAQLEEVRDFPILSGFSDHARWDWFDAQLDLDPDRLDASGFGPAKAPGGKNCQVKWSLSQNEFRCALELLPSNYEVREKLADALIEMGKYGIIELRQGRFDRAATSFRGEGEASASKSARS